MPSNDDICVLTAADDGFFEGLQLLARGLREAQPGLPLCCVDLGLTERQREWARREPGLWLMAVPAAAAEIRCDAALGLQQRKRWLKPFYVAAAPARRVVWIDADAVVLRPIDALLADLESGPVFTPDLFNPASVLNGPRPLGPALRTVVPRC